MENPIFALLSLSSINIFCCHMKIKLTNDANFKMIAESCSQLLYRGNRVR